MALPDTPTRAIRVAHEVYHEWRRATTLHSSPMHGPHEAYGVILEEVDEFWDEVKKKHPSREEMRKELIQVAAMCLRAIIDLGLDREAS